MPIKMVQKVVAYIISGLGLCLLMFSGQLQTAGNIITAASFTVSWWFEEPLISSQKYQKTWNVATVLFFIFEFIRWWSGIGFITAAVQFAAFLQINKLFNRKNQKDYDHILILSMLHLIGSSILFSDIEYALLFFFYVIVTPWFLMLGQIRREVEAKYLEKKDPGSIYNFNRVLKSRRLISGKLLAGTALLAIPIYIITGFIFLIFPRISLGIFAGGSRFSRNQVGFSDTIALGDLVPLTHNPLAVARVEFPDEEGKPSVEFLETIYWRATAYDNYDGSGWYKTLNYPGQLLLKDNYYILLNTKVFSDYKLKERMKNIKKDYLAMEITLRPLYPKLLLIPQESDFVEIKSPKAINTIIKRKLSWGPSGEVIYSDPYNTGISYIIYMKKSTITPAGRGHPFGFIRGNSEEIPDKQYLHLPEVSEKFKKLALSFMKKYPDPRTRAVEIERWFHTKFRYTRDKYIKLEKGENPVDAFLFRWKEGNCEYFSSAMTLLLRATSIPARNATGFLGGKWNKIGNHFIIRQGDAHSWVEAYIKEEGWLIFDPTPPSDREAKSINPFFSGLFQFIDLISLTWQKHVIAYDLSQQSRFVQRVYASVLKLKGNFKGIKSNFKYQFGLNQKREIAVVFIILLWFLIFKGLKGKTVTGAPLKTQKAISIKRAVNLMTEIDRRLTILGLSRPPSSPPLSHCRSVSKVLQDGKTLIELVTIYNQTRFGGKFIPSKKYKYYVNKCRNLQ